MKKLQNLIRERWQETAKTVEQRGAHCKLYEISPHKIICACPTTEDADVVEEVIASVWPIKDTPIEKIMKNITRVDLITPYVQYRETPARTARRMYADELCQELRKIISIQEDLIEACLEGSHDPDDPRVRYKIEIFSENIQDACQILDKVEALQKDNTPHLFRVVIPTGMSYRVSLHTPDGAVSKHIKWGIVTVGYERIVVTDLKAAKTRSDQVEGELIGTIYHLGGYDVYKLY